MSAILEGVSENGASSTTSSSSSPPIKNGNAVANAPPPNKSFFPKGKFIKALLPLPNNPNNPEPLVACGPNRLAKLPNKGFANPAPLKPAKGPIPSAF
jgi:hypothetical protein